MTQQLTHQKSHFLPPLDRQRLRIRRPHLDLPHPQNALPQLVSRNPRHPPRHHLLLPLQPVPSGCAVRAAIRGPERVQRAPILSALRGRDRDLWVRRVVLCGVGGVDAALWSVYVSQGDRGGR